MSQIFYPLIKHGFQKFNEYSLPVAGADTLGGVKVGSGLSIDANGVLSADGGSGPSTVLVGTFTHDENISMTQHNIRYFNGVLYLYLGFDVKSPISPDTALFRFYFEDETLKADFGLGMNLLIFGELDGVMTPVGDVFSTLNILRSNYLLSDGPYVISGSCPCSLVANS